MAHRLTSRAIADLDAIWLYVATISTSTETADRLIDAFTERFLLLARFPRIGRLRGELREGLRSFPVGEYVIFYRVDGEDVVILHVLHGRRDIETLFGR